MRRGEQKKNNNFFCGLTAYLRRPNDDYVIGIRDGSENDYTIPFIVLKE